MKTIFICQQGIHNNASFNPDVRDHCNDPFILLRDRLRARGYDLTTIDDRPIGDAERVWFFDASSVYRQRLPEVMAGRLTHQAIAFRPRDVYAECEKAGIIDRCALFLWESPVVEPRNWRADLHARFRTIFTWHDEYADAGRFHKIRLPQPARYGSQQDISFKEKKLLVNISANKYASKKRELYSARRAAIRYFERALPGDFDLYGIGWDRPNQLRARIFSWNQPPYSSYRGTVSSKATIFPRYRFALTYENALGFPGYITEKIFDCMRAGCVPIYLGASNIQDYFPTEAFVDRRKFATDAELGAYLKGISEAEYKRYRAAAYEYLASPAFVPFLEQAFVQNVLAATGLA
jgi:hypothetical protein